MDLKTEALETFFTYLFGQELVFFHSSSSSAEALPAFDFHTGHPQGKRKQIYAFIYLPKSNLETTFMFHCSATGNSALRVTLPFEFLVLCSPFEKGMFLLVTDHCTSIKTTVKTK